MNRQLVLVVGWIGVLACGPTAGEAAKWKGTQENKSGVLHMMNPAEPVHGAVTIQLQELWRLGGDTDDENEFFGVIGRITTDEKGNVYLLDSQLAEVKVFSPEGKYIRTIGREGEGPGEFRRPTDLFFVPDGRLGVLQPAPMKIVLFSKGGDPAGEFPRPALAGDGFLILIGGRPIGDNLALLGQANNFDQEKGTFTQSVFLTTVDKDGKELKRMHDEARVWEQSNPVIDERVWDTIQRRWAAGGDGRIFGVTAFEGYKIHCWNVDGSVDRVIERRHSTHKRSAEQIERVRKIYEVFTRQAPNSQLKISDTDQDIDTIHPRGNGSLWVLPSTGARSAKPGTIGTFDVFDRQGRFVQQVTLKGEGRSDEDGFFFVGDRLYVVTDLLQAAMAAQGGGAGMDEPAEEPEPMSVICYRIDDSKIRLD